MKSAAFGGPKGDIEPRYAAAGQDGHGDHERVIATGAVHAFALPCMQAREALAASRRVWVLRFDTAQMDQNGSK